MKIGKIVLYEKKEDCCGCSACYSICSSNAITMISDDEGFEYPEIDADKCLKCGMCMAVCPITFK